MPFSLLEPSQFPDTVVLGALYQGVTNHSEIRSNLISGNEAYDFAFLNAENVLSLEQLYATLFRCLVDRRNGEMKAKTVHTEIITDMSPLKNIMQSLQKFGIPAKGEKSDLVVLRVLSKEEASDDKLAEIAAGLDKIIDNGSAGGQKLTDKALSTAANFKLIQKNYKLDAAEQDPDRLNRLIVGTIQLKGL